MSKGEINMEETHLNHVGINERVGKIGSLLTGELMCLGHNVT
jgi:hypothetical protein